jgi:ankyrin repeat protein
MIKQIQTNTVIWINTVMNSSAMVVMATDFIRSGDNIKLVQKLEEDPSIADYKTETGISLLQYAVYCRNSEAVEILKKYRPITDIFEAACLGDKDQVSHSLVINPDSLHSFSPDGFTVLGLASYFGHFSLVKFLLEKGANPNTPANNQFKVAPLHSACAISNFEIAELLIKYGANVNAAQIQGSTPLHSATHNGAILLTRLLLENGADINSKMDNGQTPLSMATERNHKEISDLLRTFGGHE